MYIPKVKSAHTDVRHSLRAPRAREEVLGSQSTGFGRRWNVCREAEIVLFFSVFQEKI